MSKTNNTEWQSGKWTSWATFFLTHSIRISWFEHCLNNLWFPLSLFQMSQLIWPVVIRSQVPKVVKNQAREQQCLGGKMTNLALREQRKVNFSKDMLFLYRMEYVNSWFLRRNLFLGVPIVLETHHTLILYLCVRVWGHTHTHTFNVYALSISLCLRST